MTKDPMDATRSEFSRWAAVPGRDLSGSPAAVEAEVDLLLGLIRDHLGLDDPARLKPGDVEELLLQVYPRKVTVLDPAGAQDTIPAARDLLAFLAGTGRLTDLAARRLGRELDDVAPRFADAVMDPSRWGMARSFVQEMAADDVDLADPAAVQDWIAAYNASQQENRALDDWDPDLVVESLKETFGLPDRLPAMRLPAEDELAALARTSPLLAAAARLADWAGTGRAVDEDGELAEADIVAAAAELGLEIGGPAAVTIMDDVPELVHLWNLALDVGLLEEDDDGTTVAAGEAARLWRSGDATDALAIWSEALTFVVTESLEIDADLDPRLGDDLDFYGAGMDLITLLFLARGEGMPVAQANDVIREDTIGEPPETGAAAQAWQAWTRVHGEPAAALLSRLVELGAVHLDEVDDGTVARLTPLASWAVREQFIGSDVEVPLLPPTAEMTPADLVAAAEGATEEETVAEIDAWLALRDPGAAARELLGFGATAHPPERMAALVAVHRIGAAAEPAWRESLDVPALRPYAKMALAGDSAELTLEATDAAWLIVDLVATASESTGPAKLAAELGGAMPKGTEEVTFDAMSRLPHPDAARVLTLFGRLHPDKKIAKAARRFAYKATSRLNSSR